MAEAAAPLAGFREPAPPAGLNAAALLRRFLGMHLVADHDVPRAYFVATRPDPAGGEPWPVAVGPIERIGAVRLTGATTLRLHPETCRAVHALGERRAA